MCDDEFLSKVSSTFETKGDRVKETDFKELEAFCFDCCDSTMNFSKLDSASLSQLSRPLVLKMPAEVAALDSEAKLKMFLAREQVSGRGRTGNAWTSVKDAGIYVTYAVDGLATRDWSGLSLAISVAIAQMLEAHDIDVSLKWPNDLFAQNSKQVLGKICGIITEVSSAGNGKSHLAIGVGLNLRANPQLQEVGALAIEDCVEDSTKKADYFLVLQQLTYAVIEVLSEFLRDGFFDLRSRWLLRTKMIGKQYELDAGGELVCGVVRDVDSSGGLVVEVNGQNRTFYSASVLRELNLLN